MTLRLFTLDNDPNVIAVSKIDGVMEGGAFFLDFSRPLETHRWFGLTNRWFGFPVGLLVPVVHEAEKHGGFVISVHRDDPQFANVRKLWYYNYPRSKEPPTTVAGGLKIIADFATQFPNDCS